jgi:hypothetical protein
MMLTTTTMRSFWKVWLALVVLTFSLNLWVALVTIHGHQSTTTEASDGTISLRGFSFPQTTVTERQYWHRILQQSNAHASLSKSGSTQSNHTFFNDIQNYVQEHPNAPACVPPCIFQSLAQYSVVIYSRANQRDERSIRKLVTKVMALISYPSVKDIHLILKENETLMDDQPKYPSHHDETTKYTQRLRQWHQRGVVNIQKSTSLWDAVASLHVQTDSILWIDGDQPKEWNGTLWKTQFHAWRSSPHLLGVHHFIHVESAGKFTTRNPPPLQPCLVPAWHGLLMHRNYLCLLSHPAMASLRTMTPTWHESTTAMSLLLMVASASNNEDHDYYATLSTNELTSLTHMDATPQIDTVLRYFACPCATSSFQPSLSKTE